MDTEKWKGIAMESFEFLGGRYNRPEQIMTGPVQAFRAQNAATGRYVFIHRISTTEAAAEQSELLKLLTTALVKSSEVKRMVLDFGEEGSYWYVVTESEPQCALLREWLHLEINAVSGHPRSSTVDSAKPAVQKPAPLSTPPGEPGEFTRFLQARPQVGSSPSTPRYTPPPPAVPPPTQIPQTPSLVGEFTKAFQTPVPSAPPATPTTPFTPPPAPQPEKQEDGEFTRFFKPGLPTPSAKQSTPPASPYVQRPNSPLPPPPPPPKPNEPGEFTRMFARPMGSAPLPTPSAPSSQSPQVRSDPMGFAAPPQAERNLSDQLFDNKIDIPQPLPSSQPQESEFTKIFGSVGTNAPAIQTPGVVAPPREKPLLEERPSNNEQFMATQPLPVMKPPTPAESKPAAANGPSEFTMIMQGGYGQSKSQPDQPGSAPAKGSGGGGSGMPGNIGMTPLNVGGLTPNLGSVGGSIAGMHANANVHGASLSTPLGVVSANAPRIAGINESLANAKVPGAAKTAANKKLLIFFGALGVVALLLIILILILMKK